MLHKSEILTDTGKTEYFQKQGCQIYILQNLHNNLSGTQTSRQWLLLFAKKKEWTLLS